MNFIFVKNSDDFTIFLQNTRTEVEIEAIFLLNYSLMISNGNSYYLWFIYSNTSYIQGKLKRQPLSLTS